MKRTLLCLAAVAGLSAVAAAADPVKVVMIAGRPSHGPGEHEHNAGILLLAHCLEQCYPGIQPVVVKNGWPEDEKVFDGAAAVILFSDGGGGHPYVQGNHLETIQKLADRGTGLAMIHFAVEVPKGKPGDHFLDWIGGFYETAFSTNPHWDAAFQNVPDHPIARGVQPFTIRDEWYFNIHFRPEMKGVTPLLVAKPDDETRTGKSSSPRGPYPHIVAAKGRPEVVSWCVERPDGGRGFGFTGAHFHKNWGNPNFRTFVLNAIVWTAKQEVPSQGVQCEVTPEQLKQNLDPKGR